MRRAALTTTAVLLLALSLAGCGGRANAAGPRPRVPRTMVSVVNRSFMAYTIYVTNGQQRQRIGTVQPVSTEQMVIPASFVQTAGLLRFIADPIGSDAVASTFNVSVTPGETVTLQII